jgi:hypothetical protein
MSGAAGLYAVWVNAERQLGRKLTEVESESLYSETLASVEFWQAVHSNAAICSVGTVVVVSTVLFSLCPLGLWNEKMSASKSNSKTSSPKSY